jgi:pyruvate dehydrogenase E1 component alpha subunit/2-oxoisovalerate dehydrogenase E1 component alpha subunit
MCLIRAAEERLEILHEQGRLHASVYRSLGQEAGAVGVAAGLRKGSRGDGDYLAPSVRAGGAVLVFGETLEDFFRQHLGRGTAPSGGRQANVHRVDHARGIVGPVWPLGMMLEVVAGITLAFRLRGEDRVAAVFHGDGATSTGAWHEGLAFAAALHCPLILVVENNGWAFSTPLRGATRLESFTQKAAGYGIHAESVDGTDVVAVQDATERAAERARSGDGVQMIELRYFRRLGHAQHDAQEYVDPEVLAEWERRDPIDRSAHRLVVLGAATAEELDAVRADAVARCAAAADRVLAEAEPSGPEALEGVFTDGPLSPPWTRRSPPDPGRTPAEVR